jgi:diacylglycerol O-acyltransferase / wax synthase
VTPERLSGLDAGFLYLETPTLQMHVAIVAVFDPTTVPGGYSFRRIRQRILDRIPLVPVFQRRLVEVPLRLGHPVWVDDADFDIDNHLRRAALPSPGGMRELAEFAADVTSRQLPRDRPLWEMWLVEGLEDGKFALVAKMHHSTIDGVSGAELLGVLFDLEPEPPDQGPQGERQLDLRVPSSLELVSHALLADLVRPLGLGRTIWRTTKSIAHIRKVRQAIRPGGPGGSGGPGTGKAAIPLSAPRTSLNGSVHARRRVAFAVANLADVKKLKNAMGTTVNDVVLAICAGALRTYLLAGDELPEIPLVALVPVSVTPETAELRGSNKISGMFVQLPCELDDPLERLRFIHEGTKGAKEEHQALGADTLQNWAEHAAPNVFAAAARLYTRMRLADRHRPLANLIISNVPGPDVPLYMGGSQLLGMFPLGPVMDGMGLNMTIMSYQGVLYWGLAADARAVPRIWDIAAAIPAALSELLAAAGLDEDPFDVPLHVGPGMPTAARWIRGGVGTGAVAAVRDFKETETDMEDSDMSKAAIA